MQDAIILIDDDTGGGIRFKREPMLLFRLNPALYVRVYAPSWQDLRFRGERPMDRKRQRRNVGIPAASRLAFVDAVMLICRTEEIARRFGCLRVTKEEESRRVKRIMEDLKDMVLDVTLQVDEEIPADDEIHAGEGGIMQQVVIREKRCIAQLPPYVIMITLPYEETLEPLGAYVSFNGCRVDALPGAGQ
jgi:hypothetical protein